jgi:hypothetical protein
MSTTGNHPSFIQSLLHGGRRKKDAAVEEVVDQELDLALCRLSRALNENEVASIGVKRRQSSGSLKLLSLPEQLEAE